MARFVLLVAVVAVSTAAPLIRLAAPAPALTVAALRVGLAALLLTLAARGTVREVIALPARERWLVITAGLLLGAHFGVWITSLTFTSTAASVSLVAMQPVFAAILARALGDTIQRREIAGMAVAAAGCAVLGGGELASGSTSALIGDGLALAGALTAAGYLLVGRRLRTSMSLTPYLALVNTVAAVGLGSAAVITNAGMLGFDAHVYVAIALAAVVPSLVGHTLLNWSVRRTPAHLVTLAILGEPVGASLMTWAFFNEVPPTHALAGGVVILAGIVVGFGGR